MHILNLFMYVFLLRNLYPLLKTYLLSNLKSKIA